MNSNKYLYCVIEKPKNFSISIGGLKGEKIYLINEDKLSAVVSDFTGEEAGVTRENLLAHDEVVNKILLKEKAVLPAGFGTIIKDEGELKIKLLGANRVELQSALESVRGKAEIKVMAQWKDVVQAISSLAAENNTVKKLHTEIQGKNLNFTERVNVGKIIEKELNASRAKIKNKVIDSLAGKYLEYKENEIFGENGIFDLVFLLPLSKENEFLAGLSKLEADFNGEKIIFRYSGPTASYHFINLPLKF